MYDGINLPRYRSADIDGVLLSRRGAVVARRFPKAKVAGSIPVGGTFFHCFDTFSTGPEGPAGEGQVRRHY